ncbi:MAG: PQQ-binding-like beta-propeller repeat protein, partial [Acidobacteriota bacterium]
MRSQPTVGFPVALLAVCVLSMLPCPARGSDWPQYRGPESSGVADSGGSFAGGSGAGLKIGWRRPLGSGYSSVVVAGNRVLSMFSDGDAEFLAAFDAGTGEELWRYRSDANHKGHDGSHDGPLATPAVSDGKVVGLTPRGRLFTVRADSGKEIWTVDLTAKFEAASPYYGFGGSPLVIDGVVILQAPVPGTAVAGYDLATGERLWTAGDDRIQYQTPAVVRVGGTPVLVAAGMSRVFGIRPADGEVLWSFEHGGGGSAYGAASLTPVAAGEDRLFLAHEDDGATVFALRDQDGLVVPEQLWKNRNIRNSYSVPVYHDGFIYAFSSRFLICVDAATGEARWRSREPGDGFLMLVDGQLVILTKQGSLHVAEASPEGYHELAGIDLFEDHAWSIPAFADGHLYARSLGELARVDLGGAPSEVTVQEPPGGDVSGTRLGRFIEAVSLVDDRSGMVDRFLKAVETFPMVEGKDRVNFLYRGDVEDVAVGGDLFEVSRERPMARIEGTDLFYYSMRLEPDARVSYLFLVDFEPSLDPRNPRRTVMNVMTEDLELSFRGTAEVEMSWFAMPGWKAPDFLGKVPRSRRGKLERTEVAGEATEEPVPLHVYLPPGYERSEERYPVVYVHDGLAALERGQWKAALDNLIGSRVRPVIVVFLGAIRAETQQYCRILSEEIVPFVDRTFRTAAGRETRANVGAGLGGMMAVVCTFRDPGLAGKLGAQSALLLDYAWGPLVETIRPASETAVSIYLDWGTYDLRNSQENWNIASSNREAVRFLEGRGYRVTGGEVHDGGGWPSWHLRTGALLEA